MPDDTTRAIDRFFDIIDNGVDTAQRLFNRSSQAEDKLQPKQRRREVIEAEHAEKKTTKPASTTAPVAVAKKPHFYIVEAVDPKSGHTIFVVTDGGSARTECGTREFAAQILKALEKAP